MVLSPMKSKLRSKMFALPILMSGVGSPSNVDGWKRSSCQLIAMKSSVSTRLGSNIDWSFSVRGGLAMYDGGDSCLFLAGFVCSVSDDDGFEVFDEAVDCDVFVSFRDDAGGFPILLDGL
jgi:hypothetical protein